MEMTQAYFINTITNVLGLSVKQREVLSNDRYDTISTIIHQNFDETREWCTTKYKLTTTRGGASYGDPKTKFLQALEWCSTNFTLRGKQSVLSDFDATIMADCIYEAIGYHTASGQLWSRWCILTSPLWKTLWVPLAYVVQENPYPPGIVIVRKQEIIQNVLLQENIFYRDTKKVLAILNELTVDTDAETWVKGETCGWEEIFALQNHYDVKSEGGRRTQVDKEYLKKLFYRNKTNLSFEKYVTNTRQNFNVLNHYNVNLYEEDKVSQLLDNINFQKNNNWKLRLTSIYLFTVLASRKLPHTYQQLYHAFS